MKEKKPAIEVIQKDQCTGCFGCYNSCPFDAIDMRYNQDGFLIPVISDKCNNCGLCQNYCPVIQNQNTENKFEQPTCYGGKSTNHATRQISSSGGIFSEVARYILTNSGVVFAAAWNNNFDLEHIKIKNSDELTRITGSKYIQSNIGEVFNGVREELDENKKVLFVGTPCQVAALNLFTNHHNLLTIDLVCHGVPSNLLFKKYLEYIKKEKGNNIKQVSFRDKKKGWKDFQIKIVFEDGSVYCKHHKLDPYFRAYLSNLCLRNSCYKCGFSHIPRPGDITLGDFWGNSLEDKKTKEGFSVILANNEKGDGVLNYLQRTGRVELEKTDFDTATESNPRINGGEFKVPWVRNNILYDLTTQEFVYIKKKYIKNPNPLKFQLNRYLQKIVKFYKS